MVEEPRITELHQRLQQLESELAERRSRLSKAGTLQPHHHREAEEISSRAGEMRTKLTTASNTGWGAMRHEVEADWASLMGSFERWVRHVDNDYGPGSS